MGVPNENIIDVHSDDAFWKRMDSKCSSTDLPEMARSDSKPHAMPRVELLVATPAGKPAFHYTHGQCPRQVLEEQNDVTFERDPQHVLSLCATAVAFAAVAPQVHSVVTRGGVLFFASSHSLYITVSAANPRFPVPILAGLARLVVAFFATTFSARFAKALVMRPNFDLLPLITPVRDHLTKLIDRALAHPFLYFSVLVPSLPCPTMPSSRQGIASMLRTELLRASPAVTHAIVMTATPPFPRKLITVAAPSTAPLTPLDKVILASLPPDDFRQSKLNLPQRLYLQSSEYDKPSVLAILPVSLRLHADDYKMFETAVGGSSWRPEWGSSGGDVVWIMVIASMSTLAEQSQHVSLATDCAEAIERGLCASRAIRDIIVAMERPWVVSDIPRLAEQESHKMVQAIVVMSGDRIAATMGATEHKSGIIFTNALHASGWISRENVIEIPGHRNVFRHVAISGCSTTSNTLGCTRQKVWRYAQDGRQVYGLKSDVMVLFDGSLSRSRASFIFVDIILPWANRYHRSIFSEFDRVDLPPNTMFRNLFAPFPS